MPRGPRSQRGCIAAGHCKRTQTHFLLVDARSAPARNGTKAVTLAKFVLSAACSSFASHEADGKSGSQYS